MTAIHAPGAPRPMSPLRATARWIAILIICFPGFAATVQAQASAGTAQASPHAAVNLGAELDASAVELLVGRSAVLNVPSPIARVSLTSPDIADALVTTTQQVLVHGKTPGTISMFVWDRAGAIRRYEVVVRRDLSELELQLRQLFPNEPIAVTSSGSHVILSGFVSNKPVIERAGDVAAGYVAKKEDVVNLLQQPAGAGSNQVLLRVRFAEVSRTALTELGATWFTSNNGYKDYVARVTSEQFPSVGFTDRIGPPPASDPGSEGKMVFSDFLNFFLFNTKYDVGALVKVLATRGLFQSLAEPNLVAQDGKEASFLAGGEYPYPVVQGSSAGLAVTIQFKEFGIKLNFTPTIVGGDLVHLKVRPEVSSLDFTNAISLQGFRVPALSTRRAETEVELRDGQTFAVAGLLNNTMTSTMQKIPGIGDIPVLGLLFKSKAARKEQTELVVLITPHIMRPTSPGAATALPGLAEPFLPPIQKPVPMPPPFGPQGSVAPGAPGGTQAIMPVTPAAAPLAGPAPVTKTTPPAKPAEPTKEARQAIERAQKEQRVRQAEAARARLAEEQRAAEAAKAEAKRAAAQAKIDARRAAELKQQQEKAAQARAIQNARASLQAEAERKKREEAERKRGKEIAEAEARLKAAQAAFEEQLKHSSSRNQQ